GAPPRPRSRRGERLACRGHRALERAQAHLRARPGHLVLATPRAPPRRRPGLPAPGGAPALRHAARTAPLGYRDGQSTMDDKSHLHRLAGALKDNAHDLESELEWFAQVLDARLSDYFAKDGPRHDAREIAPPSLEGKHSDYAAFFRQH